MALDDYCYDGTTPFDLSAYPTSAKLDEDLKKDYKKRLQKNVERIAELQDKLFAAGREGVVFVFQALDAAGKDSTIEHVFSGVNPIGVPVASFKTPSKEELAHDYLWRVVKELPRRGEIGVFNRSHYEDVLVVRVKNMRPTYKMPARFNEGSDDDFFDARYRQIRDFERYLYENGYRVVKFFLNVSKAEQANRFISRIDEQHKNWKFSAGDVAERIYWDDYQDAFQEAIAATSTPEAPWYIIPADQKFYARWLVSEAVIKVLEEIDPQYPQASEEDLAAMAECREKLVAGKA